jgi:4-diphosphocytidyl-2-C-methyl-D-erythritol kinase
MELEAPAKINLYLEVVARRADGYHELRTLMCPVSLCDTVRIRLADDGIQLQCRAPGVPENASNLAWQAAEAFCRSLARQGAEPPGGVRIELEKRIPVGGGLGGGSSDAAAVLLGLNRILENPFSPLQLARMASGLGADVPFFLLRKPALATGIGDRLAPFEGLFPHPVIIVDPGFSLSTAAVYAGLNLALTKCGERHRNLAFRERKPEVAKLLCNDLETAVFPRHPVLEIIKNTLLEFGALGSLMSGSGACVFGIFTDSAGARQAFERISQARSWRLHLAEMMV